jgi:4-hydroxy-4-methyl-2-oxoglutarate aldolase
LFITIRAARRSRRRLEVPLSRLTADQLDALRTIDSPTVSNAIEQLGVRPRLEGFAGWGLRCAFPELGTMAGYAVTCTADSTTESRRDARGLLPLWDAVEAAPKPVVIVIKDIGPERHRSCHMGEVMATTARALGAVGCVSDGGLRDVVEVRALGGFQYFCPGFVVSHGNPVICEVNVPVTLEGLTLEPGDLVHGDVNGVLVIPGDIADRVAEQAERVRAAERLVLDFVRSPGLTVEKLRAFQEKFRH